GSITGAHYYLEVVVSAGDGASGDAGQDFDVAEDIEFGEAGEHSHVKQGRAEAAAGKGEAHLANPDGAQGGDGVADQRAESAPGFGMLGERGFHDGEAGAIVIADARCFGWVGHQRVPRMVRKLDLRESAMVSYRGPVVAIM